jgi:hypothetical protein
MCVGVMPHLNFSDILVNEQFGFRKYPFADKARCKLIHECYWHSIIVMYQEFSVILLKLLTCYSLHIND